MQRRVEPEWLDELPPTDPQAIAARRDLQRVNRWMGNARIMADALHCARIGTSPAEVVELGAGDGTFLLDVIRRTNWKDGKCLLLDRANLLTAETGQRFTQLGWKAQPLQTDVMADWGSWQTHADVIVANLFLHHFDGEKLRELLHHAAGRARLFVAVEPRRSLLALVFSRLTGLIGCNRVTRHDAAVSVKAGFASTELSQLWPTDNAWRLKERPAGLFSHLFVAAFCG